MIVRKLIGAIRHPTLKLRHSTSDLSKSDIRLVKIRHPTCKNPTSNIRLVKIRHPTCKNPTSNMLKLRHPACLHPTSNLLKSKKGSRNRKENGECTDAINRRSRVGLSNSFYKYETYRHSTNVKEHKAKNTHPICSIDRALL